MLSHKYLSRHLATPWKIARGDQHQVTIRSEGICYTRTGPQSFWEDPFVVAFSMDWRIALVGANMRLGMPSWRLKTSELNAEKVFAFGSSQNVAPA